MRKSEEKELTEEIVPDHVLSSEMFTVLKAIVLTGGLILTTFQGKVKNTPKTSDLPENMIEDSSIAHTPLDDLIQENALEILASHMPNIGINVEEKTDRINLFSNNKKNFCFHLDPLDGTLAFLQDRKDYSVGAAFSRNLHFIASAVYFPAFDRLYFAEKSKGIKVFDSLGKGQSLSQSEQSFKRLSTPNSLYCQKRCDNLVKILDKMGLSKLDCLSAHHKVIYVAEGKASVQMCHLASPHDFGIPQVILEEAGGVCTDLEGNPIRYDETFARLPYFLGFYDESVKNAFFENI
jgi:myo-inositol-1(or 4)-monophosphatase